MGNLIVTNGALCINFGSDGRISKVTRSKAMQYNNLAAVVDLMKANRSQTKGYWVLDVDTDRACYFSGYGSGYRRRYSRDARQLIYEKASGRCELCGKHIRFEDMTLDHIVPLAHNGIDDVSNVQCSCRACNQFKGAVAPEIFYDKIASIHLYQMEKRLGNGFRWRIIKWLMA